MHIHFRELLPKSRIVTDPPEKFKVTFAKTLPTDVKNYIFINRDFDSVYKELISLMDHKWTKKSEAYVMPVYNLKKLLAILDAQKINYGVCFSEKFMKTYINEPFSS